MGMSAELEPASGTAVASASASSITFLLTFTPTHATDPPSATR